MSAWIIDLKIFLFSNVHIYCYQFSSLHCFSCVTWSLICCILAFLQFNVFLFTLIVSLWSMSYVEVYCLISQCLEIFCLSSCFLLLVWLHCDRRTYSLWLQFLKICWSLFYYPGYGLYWHIYMRTWKECVLCCWCEVLYKYWLEFLIDRIVEFFFIVADFLPSCFLFTSCWQRDFEVPDCNCGFACVSFQFYLFLLHIFCSPILGRYICSISVSLLRSDCSHPSKFTCWNSSNQWYQTMRTLGAIGSWGSALMNRISDFIPFTLWGHSEVYNPEETLTQPATTPISEFQSQNYKE